MATRQEKERNENSTWEGNQILPTAISTSITTSITTPSQALSTKRTHSDTVVDEDDEADHQIRKTRKSQKAWSNEEDDIIIEEYGKNPGNFSGAAVQRLPDRSTTAVRNRWKKHLRKQHPSAVNIARVAPKKWTPEEDAIILREYEKNPDDYTAAVVKELPDRTNVAVWGRWSSYLYQKHSDTTSLSYKKWTPEEDAIIISEYQKKPRNYTKEAEKRLPGRNRRAIKLRWFGHLKFRNSNVVNGATERVKWTKEEDDIVVREYEKDPKNYSITAIEILPGRSRVAIQRRWQTHLSKDHRSLTAKHKKWTPEEDAIILREYQSNPRSYTAAAFEHLPGRSRIAISARWNSHLKKQH